MLKYFSVTHFENSGRKTMLLQALGNTVSSNFKVPGAELHLAGGQRSDNKALEFFFLLCFFSFSFNLSSIKQNKIFWPYDDASKVTKQQYWASEWNWNKTRDQEILQIQSAKHISSCLNSI